MTEQMKIALIGECMIELNEISPGVISQTFGGDTLNTAIYCARLARELPLAIDYVTALGDDTFSDRMVAFWEREGVGSSLVLREPRETPGLYYIELDEAGERIFHYWRSTAAAKKCFEFDDSERIIDALADYDGIYLSGISLAILTPASRERLIDRLVELAAAGTAVYFDCNYRPHLWNSAGEAIAAYGRLYPISEIVFLTTEEADVLLDGAGEEETHRLLREAGAGESVLKDGEKPCSIYWNGSTISVPALTVDRVVDTTAAGDSFSAVYLVARKFGCSPENAATMAHQTAGYVVQHKGAIAPIEEMSVSGLDILGCARTGTE